MEIIGDDPTAILEVTPGNKPGNAVVGITNTAGEILWSWHLWVSDYDPNDDTNTVYKFRKYEFLDRNIGALTDAPGTPKNLGLYYQWGRKDPFPSATGVGSSSFVPIHDEDGEPTTIQKKAR